MRKPKYKCAVCERPTYKKDLRMSVLAPSVFSAKEAEDPFGPDVPMLVAMLLCGECELAASVVPPALTFRGHLYRVVPYFR